MHKAIIRTNDGLLVLSEYGWMCGWLTNYKIVVITIRTFYDVIILQLQKVCKSIWIEYNSYDTDASNMK